MDSSLGADSNGKVKKTSAPKSSFNHIELGQMHRISLNYKISTANLTQVKQLWPKHVVITIKIYIQQENPRSFGGSPRCSLEILVRQVVSKCKNGATGTNVAKQIMNNSLGHDIW